MKKISLVFVVLIFFTYGCTRIAPAAKTTTEMSNTQQNPATGEGKIPTVSGEAKSEGVVNSQAAPVTVNYSDQTSWILGYFTPGRLINSVHSAWYINGKDDYQPNSESLNKLLDISKENVTIKIVLGTWCPDSRREVPRFMRIIDIWQFPYPRITFIGVDNAKLSPVGEYDKLEIQRVPTFIIYKNNIEAGRIIETPVTSLEQDIVNILTRNK